jgi:hypothetical protein
MLHRPPLPEKVHKPTLPLPLTQYRDYPDMESFEEAVQELLAMAETSDATQMSGQVDAQAYEHLHAGASDLLLAAIDPATGDSIIHRAAAAGNLKVLHAIYSWFGRNWASQPEKVREFWLIVTHQNLVGNTALHAAARAGNRNGVKGVYRLFHRKDCSNVDSDREDLVSGEPNIPVEYLDWEAVGGYNPLGNRLALDFVCTKNQAGLDAAGEARAAGHEKLAVWLDGLAARIDRDGMRGDAEYMKEARRMSLARNSYHEDG